jgi:hypothetical protein
LCTGKLQQQLSHRDVGIDCCRAVHCSEIVAAVSDRRKRWRGETLSSRR